MSEQETEVWYSSEAVVVGRLGKFGFNIMKKKAESLGRDFANAFKMRVELPPGSLTISTFRHGFAEQPSGVPKEYRGPRRRSCAVE